MDLVLKYLPLIIFIYPILSWLDGRKRFSHNAKFYSDRASYVKKYEEESSRHGISDFEKSAFAQALAATDKLGFREIDIVKLQYPDRFFIIIEKVKKIRNKIIIEKSEGKDIFISKKTLKALQFRPVLYFIFYFSSVPIFISNSLLVWLFKRLDWNLFLVGSNTFLFTQIVVVVIGIGVAVTAVMKYMSNEVLVSLIKYDKIVISKDAYEKAYDNDK